MKAFLMIFFIFASGLPFIRMMGLEAQAQTFYQCQTDADCERQCDPNGCLMWLALPSTCYNGQCACPFGPAHYVATRILINSTCTHDVDCSNLCPSFCNIKSCLEQGKCECGCEA